MGLRKPRSKKPPLPQSLRRRRLLNQLSKRRKKKLPQSKKRKKKLLLKRKTRKPNQLPPKKPSKKPLKPQKPRTNKANLKPPTKFIYVTIPTIKSSKLDKLEFCLCVQLLYNTKK